MPDERSPSRSVLAGLLVVIGSIGGLALLAWLSMGHAGPQAPQHIRFYPALIAAGSSSLQGTWQCRRRGDGQQR